MSTDLEKVRDVLRSGEFAQLIGMVEDDVFEAKAQPYALQTSMQKLELAKDVVALANAGGGVIILGLRTESVAFRFGDEVKEVRSFDGTLFKVSQYESVIRDWIYPSLVVRLDWYPCVNEPNRGLGAIWVERQAESVKPFLLVRVSLEEQGESTTTILCGVAERRLGRVAQLSVEEVHALIRDGRSRRELQEIHEGIRALRNSQEQQRTLVHRQSRLNQTASRIDHLRSLAQLSESPTYSLSITPADPIEIPSLFKDRFSPVFQIIDSPPELRRSGFHIYSLGEPEMHGGESLRAAGHGAGLELWVDGTLAYVTYGDGGYLCWRSPQGYPPRINPLTLIETVYLFLLMGRQIYEHAEPLPSGYHCQISLKSLHMRERVRMIPGRLGDYEDAQDSKYAPQDEQVFSYKSPSPIDPGAVAYRLVKQIYNWFGFTDSSIPYVEELQSGVIVVSPRAILALESRAR